MNDGDFTDDNNNNQCLEDREAKDRLALEYGVMAARGDQEKRNHQTLLYIGVGAGLLLLIILIAVLIPTVFLNHNSGKIAEAVQGFDSGPVSCRY
jgi:hypothetical protein